MKTKSATTNSPRDPRGPRLRSEAGAGPNKLPRQNELRGLRQNGRRNEVDEASVDVSILQVS